MPNGVARLRHESVNSRGDIGRQCSVLLSKALAVLSSLIASLAISGSSHRGAGAYHRKGRPRTGVGKEVHDRPNFANLIPGFGG